MTHMAQMLRSRLGAGLAVAGTAAAAAACAGWLLRRVEVGGASMEPTLRPGDRLLVVRSRRPRPGDLVAVSDPREPSRLMVKRLTAVEVGGYVVAGDHPAASTDSRHFGTVPRRHLWGVAVYRYAPDGRVGRLRRGEPGNQAPEPPRRV